MMLSVAFGAQPTADAWRGRFPPRADPGAGAVRVALLHVRAVAGVGVAARARVRVTAGELASASASALAKPDSPPRSERVGVRTPELSRERLARGF